MVIRSDGAKRQRVYSERTPWQPFNVQRFAEGLKHLTHPERFSGIPPPTRESCECYDCFKHTLRVFKGYQVVDLCLKHTRCGAIVLGLWLVGVLQWSRIPEACLRFSSPQNAVLREPKHLKQRQCFLKVMPQRDLLNVIIASSTRLGRSKVSQPMLETHPMWCYCAWLLACRGCIVVENS